MVPGVSTAARLIDRFDLLVGSVDQYAIFMLDPDGNVTSWNRGAERIKGHTVDEIIGQSFTIFYTAGDLASGKPASELAAAAASGQHHDEGWRVRSDSSTFWANVLITAISDADGHLIGYANITRDETDRKIAEEMIQQMHLMTERDRVAREIQESVVRQIFRASLRLSAIANLIADPQITSRILSSIADLDATLKGIRDVITDHHPTRLAPHPHTTVRSASRQLASGEKTAASFAATGHKIVGRRADRFTARTAHDSHASGTTKAPFRGPRNSSTGTSLWGYTESNCGPHPYQGCALTD